MRAIRSEDRKYIGSRKDRVLIGTRQSVRCSLVLLAYLLTCLPAYLMSDYYASGPIQSLSPTNTTISPTLAVSHAPWKSSSSRFSISKPVSRAPEMASSSVQTWYEGPRDFESVAGLKLRRSQIRDDVTQWLIDNFVVLSLGQQIHSFGNSHCAEMRGCRYC